MNESNYIHLYLYSIFTVIYISNNDTMYPTLNILFLTMITISILTCGVLSYIQQIAYSDSFVENLANSFFNQSDSVRAPNNTSHTNLSKFASNNVTSFPNVSSAPNSQQLSMKQICLNSSIVKDQFAKQQCDATMYNKFLRTK